MSATREQDGIAAGVFCGKLKDGVTFMGRFLQLLHELVHRDSLLQQVGVSQQGG